MKKIWKVEKKLDIKRITNPIAPPIKNVEKFIAGYVKMDFFNDEDHDGVKE